MPSHGHPHRHDRQQRPPAAETGGERPRRKLNVKLVVILLLVPFLVVVAGITVAVVMRGGDGLEALTRRHDPTYYMERGDALMEQASYKMALRQYEAAAHYEPGNVAALLRIVGALEKITPETPEKAAKNINRQISLLYRVTETDATNEAAQKQLLDLLYRATLKLGQAELARQLLDASDKFLKNHPERTYALKFKALAQVELLKRQQLSDLERLATHADLELALRIFPDDPVLLSGLSIWNNLEAARLKQEKGDAVDVSKYENKAEDILRKLVAKAPNELETKLQLARTLYAHNKKTEGMAVLNDIEQHLLAQPDPVLSVDAANFILAADTDPVALHDGTLVAGGVARAEKILAAALEKQPDDMRSLFALAALKKRTGSRDVAIELLKSAIASQAPLPDDMGGMGARQIKLAATAELTDIHLVLAEGSRDPAERAGHIASARELIGKLGAETRSSALVDLLDGKIALLEGNSAKAIIKFEAADRKFDGRNPEAVFLSAIALQRSGETGAAIQRLERLSQAPLNNEVRLRTGRELAKLYLQTGNVERARRQIDAVLRTASEDDEALLIKSEIISRMPKEGSSENQNPANFNEALALLKPMAEDGDLKARLQMARLFMQNNRPEEARSILEGGLEENPDNLILLQQLVQLDMRLDDKQKAVARLDEAIRDNPENRTLPLLKRQVEGGEETVGMLEQLLKEMPDPLSSALGLHTLYKNTGRAEEAKAQLLRAQEAAPDDPKVLGIAFQEAVEAQDWAAAQAVCDRVAELDLDEARGAFWQGRLELARGQYVRAASAFQAGIRKRPLYSDGWKLLGDSHRLAGRLTEAENAYQEAIRMKPNNLSALYNLFIVHDSRGLRQLALADLEQAMSLAPNDPLINSAYLAYLGKSDPAKALEIRRRKLRQEPEDWRNRLEVASLLVATGKNDQARQIFKALADERPDDLEILLRAAQFRRDEGDIDGGRRLLQEYLERKGADSTLQDWLLMARFLISCNLAQAGVAAYEKAITIEDKNLKEASRELGDWYFNNQFFAKALPLYEAAYETGKETPRLTLRYIETLIYNNHADRAQKLLEDYLKTNEQTEQTALLQCIIAIETKEFKKAEGFAETAVRLGPSSPQAYLYRARLNYLKEGQGALRRQIIQDLEKALSLDPALLAAREMLVDCHLAESPPDFGKAIAQLERIIEVKPDAYKARAQLIQLLLQQEKLPQASQAVDAAIRQNPNLPAWYDFRATIRQKEGRHQDALEDLQKLLALSKTATALARFADGLIIAGQPQKAVEILDSVADDVAKDPVLMALKGKAQDAGGNRDLARISFEMAFKQAVQDPATLRNLLNQAESLVPPETLVEVLDKTALADKTGSIDLYLARFMLKAGKANDAVIRFERVHRSLPKSSASLPPVLHQLATCYQQIGRFKEAADIYRELTALAPKDFIALNNLAYILCENLDDPKEAVNIATQALELAPNDDRQRSNILDTLGWACFKAGDEDKARAHLTESVRRDPGLHNQLHLAQVLIAKGLDRDARLRLRSLRRTAQNVQNTEFEKKAEELLDSLDN